MKLAKKIRLVKRKPHFLRNPKATPFRGFYCEFLIYEGRYLRGVIANLPLYPEYGTTYKNNPATGGG